MNFQRLKGNLKRNIYAKFQVKWTKSFRDTGEESYVCTADSSKTKQKTGRGIFCTKFRTLQKLIVIYLNCCSPDLFILCCTLFPFYCISFISLQPSHPVLVVSLALKTKGNTLIIPKKWSCLFFFFFTIMCMWVHNSFQQIISWNFLTTLHN